MNNIFKFLLVLLLLFNAQAQDGEDTFILNYEEVDIKKVRSYIGA